jgi:pyruvate, orthophosphate dikinase
MYPEEPVVGHSTHYVAIWHRKHPTSPRVQVRAIISAAINAQRAGVTVAPDIMVPLVSCLQELQHQEKVIRAVATEVMQTMGETVNYRVGTMIETPRAALMAAELATVAEFFSFGTNDLTQMTYGLSRDDIGKFLPVYLEDKLFPADPFQVSAARVIATAPHFSVHISAMTHAQQRGFCAQQAPLVA